MSRPAAKPSPTYAEAGVDISAGAEMVEAIASKVRSTHKHRPGAGKFGGFAGLFDLAAAGYRDPLLAAATDGVGTKIKIAVAMDDHGGIGIDLVAMCVNDLIAQGVEPLFFLDYFAMSKLDVKRGNELVRGIAEGCRQARCVLIGGETAEMPGFYASGDYDLAGFAVGAVERGEQLPSRRLGEGDVLLGIASSGLHANGFSLVRHVIEERSMSLHKPAPFDNDLCLGQALLIPTRIYVRPLLEAIHQTKAVHALVHVTGGGVIENLPRVLPKSLMAHVSLSTFKPLPVFQWLYEEGNIEASEMLRTFNCGIGMIAIVAKERVDEVRSILLNDNHHVEEIGQIERRASSGPPLQFHGELFQ